MIILGIDPGIANTGFGVIKKAKTKFCCLGYGLIKTTPDFSTPDRLKKINNDLSKIIKKYRPNALIVENLYFFINAKTIIPVSQAKGVILLTAAKNKIPAFQITPLEVKMTITGFGRAEKEIVQKKIKKALNLKEIPKPDDVADALAIALTFFLKKEIKRA